MPVNEKERSRAFPRDLFISISCIAFWRIALSYITVQSGAPSCCVVYLLRARARERCNRPKVNTKFGSRSVAGLFLRSSTLTDADPGNTAREKDVYPVILSVSPRRSPLALRFVMQNECCVP